MGWDGIHSLSGLRLSREISLAPQITLHNLSAGLPLGYSSKIVPSTAYLGRQAKATGVDRLLQ